MAQTILSVRGEARRTVSPEYSTREDFDATALGGTVRNVEHAQELRAVIEARLVAEIPELGAGD